MSIIPIIFGAVGIAIILIIYLPYLAEKKRQEEHQREIEKVNKKEDENEKFDDGFFCGCAIKKLDMKGEEDDVKRW